MNTTSHISTEFVTIGDRFHFEAFQAEGPNPTAGLILIQEIFGVTENLKSLAVDYARQGFRVVIPSLFDRIEPGIVVPYTDHDRGKLLMSQCQIDDVLEDLGSAMNAARVNNSVAAIGFCWGGTLAYLMACKFCLTAAVAFYGAGIKQHLEKTAQCPIQFHFGGQDSMIPSTDIQTISHAMKGQEIYTYDGAQHAFVNSDRKSFDPEHASLALKRATAFIRSHTD